MTTQWVARQARTDANEMRRGREEALGPARSPEQQLGTDVERRDDQEQQDEQGDPACGAQV